MLLVLSYFTAKMILNAKLVPPLHLAVIELIDQENHHNSTKKQERSARDYETSTIKPVPLHQLHFPR